MNGHHNATRATARTVADAAYIPVADASGQGFQSLTLIANAPAAAAEATLTVQIKKATSAAGANAADHGPLITKTAGATAQDLNYQVDVTNLGATAAGVPYTHVAIDTGGTATTIERIAVRGAPRYT